MKKKNTKLNAICNTCGGLIPNENDHCLVCGAAIGKANLGLEPSPHNPAKEISREDMAKQRRFLRGFLFFVIMSLLAGALLTFAFEFYNLRRLESIYSTKDSYAFQDGRNRLVIKLSTVADLIVLEDNYSNFAKNISIKNSYDNRFVAYLNNQTSISGGTRGHLSLLDLTSLDVAAKDRKTATLVSDSRIIDYSFVPKNNVIIYLTEEKELFALNYTKLTSAVFKRDTNSILLDINVSGIYDIDENAVLYYKGDNLGINSLANNQGILDGQPVDLYTANISSSTISPIFIAEKVYTILDSYKDFSTVLYTKLNDNASFSVFSYKGNSVTQLIVSADFVSEGNAITGDVVYGVRNPKIFEFTQLINDDLLDWDAAYDMLQGQLKDAIEITITKGYEAPLDTTQANPDVLGGGLPFGETQEEQVSSSDLEDFFETLPTDFNGVPLSYEQLEESKALRESVRSKLVMAIREYNSTPSINYSLYYLSNFGESSKTLTNELYDFHSGSPLVVSDLKSGIILFSEANLALINRGTLSYLSSKDGQRIIEEGLNLSVYLAEHLPEQLYYFNVETQTKNMLFTESGEKTIVRYTLSEDLSKIYFITLPHYNSRGGTLYSVDLTKGESGATVYIDDTVSKVIGSINGSMPGLVYQTVSDDLVPEYALYLSANVGIIHLSGNTGSSRFVAINNARDKVYFYRDYNTTNKAGELYLVSDLVEQAVEGNISSCVFLGDDKVLFLRLTGSLISLYEEDGLNNQSLISDTVYSYHFFDTVEFPFVGGGN